MYGYNSAYGGYGWTSNSGYFSGYAYGQNAYSSYGWYSGF